LRLENANTSVIRASVPAVGVAHDEYSVSNRPSIDVVSDLLQVGIAGGLIAILGAFKIDQRDVVFAGKEYTYPASA
jgi:hypothetical protein